jgi:hypothetical protein
MSDPDLAALLTDIRNWVRAASFSSVKALLEEALPDEKSRVAYQMMDGTSTAEQVRVASKLSPNTIVTLGQKCTAMGIMEITPEKKRRRLFDLQDFNLIRPKE